MPDFDITDAKGRTITMSGSRPPNEAEIRQAFAAAFPETLRTQTPRSTIGQSPFAWTSQPRTPGTPADARAVGRELLNLAPLVASGTAAAITGGGSLAVQAAGQATAGLLSGALRSRRTDTPVQTLTQAGADVGTNLLGLGVGAGLQKVAPAIMEGALRMSAPIRRKFGELGETAIANRILPTWAGADKAKMLRNIASAQKEDALRGTGAMISPGPIVEETATRLRPEIAAEFRAKVRPNAELPEMLREFAADNPRLIPAHELDATRSKWSNVMDAAERAAEQGHPILANEKTPGILAQASGRQLESVLPDYATRNREIMNLEGVRQAAQGRAVIPARGLENIGATYAPSPYRLAARFARIPKVMGSGAIAADALGRGMQAMPSGELLRLAILKLLQPSGGQ